MCSSDLLTPGEIEILTNENLEKFRKYLTRVEKEREDEFEKYYVSKFGQESEVGCVCRVISLLEV